MRGAHIARDCKPHVLIAQQLRDQRQVEPLAGIGRSAGDLRKQFVTQRAKIGSAERHRRQLGESDPIGAKRLGRSDRFVDIRLHSRTPRMANDVCATERGASGIFLSVIPRLPAAEVWRSTPGWFHAAFAAALAGAANCEETSPWKTDGPT